MAMVGLMTRFSALMAVGGVDASAQQDDDLQRLTQDAAPVSLAVEDGDVSVVLEEDESILGFDAFE